MSDQTDTRTTVQTQATVGATAVSVPELKNEVVPYAESQGEDRQKLEALIAELDLRDSNSIIFFGSKAQEQLTTVSDQMLEGVKNKDLGAAGDALSEMVTTLRGFDTDPLEKPGFFARLFGKAKPVVKFLQRYEGVRRQIDKITNDLDSHKTKLLTDITMLDRLYDANLEYFHELELYIAAGEERLQRLDTHEIPALEQATATTDEVIKAQELRDLRSARDDLERRVHDLRLTRQITMQSLPGIRLVQENDKGLVTKINSVMANTIPLWRQQLATAVTIYRSGQAADSVKAATDLTNELLESTSEALKTANAETRRQLERGVVDVESVKTANQNLIDTIEESLQIADEGKRARAEAVTQLQEMETQLRETLAAASARASGKTGS
ncbi:MAG: toxic anion resistance protein [Gammaproteobacteria bacterium]|nr:toxic anion resistance protein [Gammaproteobacteria bacterium]NNF61055.1 toxic anion resistance protein [Gammaproteobacteria bacterium]NNM21432.1 toxic anion resistance protein [Gammaproteobacteria bacterium]